MAEIIERVEQLLSGDWEINPDIELGHGSVVITVGAEVAQLRHNRMNIWNIYDIESGEALDSRSIEPEDFPVFVVLRCFMKRGEDKNLARERSLVAFFNDLEGGAPALAEGAL